MKMTMGPEMRYGKALFALFIESGDKSISKNIGEIRKLFGEGGELNAFLADAAVDKDDKKKVLLNLLSSLKTSTAITNFASLMCDKSRANLFEGALSWFHFYEMAENGVVIAPVRTAVKLTAPQKKSIEKFVKDNAVNAKTVELEEKIDSALVAGFKIRIGSIEYDMSVRGRLDALRTSLN